MLPDMVYKIVPLLNVSSKEMNVIGSSGSPIYFSFSPAPTEVWYLEGLSIFLLDSGSPDANEFASLGGLFGGGPLTNGLDLEIKSLNSTQLMCNIKDNMDLSCIFSDFTFSPPTASGWLNSTDMAVLSIKLDQHSKLDGSQGDYIRFKIQDDLSQVEFLRCYVKLRRKI